MVNQAVRATNKLAPVVETIFHWKVGDPSHCLVRIYRDEQQQQTLVVISEIASNQGNTSISETTVNIVSAINARFQEHLGPELEKTIWLMHFGCFSKPLTFENLHRSEEFSRIEFVWEEDSPIQETSETVLFTQDIAELFPRLELELGQHINNDDFSSVVSSR